MAFISKIYVHIQEKIGFVSIPKGPDLEDQNLKLWGCIYYWPP